MTATPDAHAFLAAIQPDIDPDRGETCELRMISPNRQIIRRFFHSKSALVAASKTDERSHNAYVGVVLRRGRDGTAAGVSRARACWADIDAKLCNGSKAAALSAIDMCAIPASVVVDSGGGYQPYWRLVTPADLTEPTTVRILEAVNGGLARLVCGENSRPDAVHDAPRILRLPGTFNHKPEYGEPRPVTIVRWMPDRRYALADLLATLSVRIGRK